MNGYKSSLPSGSWRGTLHTCQFFYRARNDGFTPVVSKIARSDSDVDKRGMNDNDSLHNNGEIPIQGEDDDVVMGNVDNGAEEEDIGSCTSSSAATSDSDSSSDDSSTSDDDDDEDDDDDDDDNDNDGPSVDFNKILDNEESMMRASNRDQEDELDYDDEDDDADDIPLVEAEVVDDEDDEAEKQEDVEIDDDEKIGEKSNVPMRRLSLEEPEPLVIMEDASQPVLPEASEKQEATQPLARPQPQPLQEHQDQQGQPQQQKVLMEAASPPKKEDITAWKEVRAHLTKAISVAQQSIEVKKQQRRFWFETICSNLNSDGKLAPYSVWKRPASAAPATRLKVRAPPRKPSAPTKSSASAAGSHASSDVKKRKQPSSTATSANKKRKLVRKEGGPPKNKLHLKLSKAIQRQKDEAEEEVLEAQEVDDPDATSSEEDAKARGLDSDDEDEDGHMEGGDFERERKRASSFSHPYMMAAAASGGSGGAHPPTFMMGNNASTNENLTSESEEDPF